MILKFQQALRAYDYLTAKYLGSLMTNAGHWTRPRWKLPGGKGHRTTKHGARCSALFGQELLQQEGLPVPRERGAWSRAGGGAGGHNGGKAKGPVPAQSELAGDELIALKTRVR